MKFTEIKDKTFGIQEICQDGYFWQFVERSPALFLGSPVSMSKCFHGTFIVLQIQKNMRM